MTSDPPNQRWRLGEVVFDPADGTLWRDGRRVDLTPKVLAILNVLVEAAPRMVAKEHLLDTVWPEAVVAEAALTQRVRDLREALGDDARTPRFIETVARRGYRLIAPVERLVDAPAPGEPASPPPNHAEIEASPPVSSGWRRWWPAAALAAAVVIGGLVAWRSSRPFWTPAAPPTPAPSPFTPRRAVAVIEPGTDSGRADMAWIGTALAEMLTTELAAGGTLRTVSPASLAEAGRELGLGGHLPSQEEMHRLRTLLGIDLLVTGRYRTSPAGSLPEVSVDLDIRAADSGASLATVTEAGPLSALPDLAGRAGDRLRHLLGVPELPAPEATRVRAVHPTNLDATRLYAEGLARLRVFEFPAALDALRKAVAAEPDSPVLRVALATAWGWSGDQARRRAELQEALKLAGKLPREPQLALEAEYREQMGEWERAIEITRSLRAFYPDNLEYGLSLVSLLVQHGHDEEAQKLLTELRALPGPAGRDPRIDLAEAWMHESDLTWKLAAASRAAERAQVLGARLMLAAARIQQGRAFRGLGKPAEARSAFREALELRQAAGDLAGVAKALTHVAKSDRDYGDLESARRHLEKAIVISDRLGNDPEVFTARLDLGAVLLDEGKLTAASWNLNEVDARAQRSGQAGKRAMVGVELARLELARRQPAEAVARARQAIADSQAEHFLAGEVEARALLVRALLATGRSGEARDESAHAMRLVAGTDDRAVRLQVAVAAAEETSARGDAVAARRALEQALAEASQAPLGVRLEAQLVLAGCARRSGDEGAARTTLLVVEEQARRCGYSLIAQAARPALGAS
ncbi:MAG: winged helix-turn-helix domain-containing protein [Thermoanaerobaculaceae bacterium]|jgi:DNA-binding winged helix-turn-helix (wHTH) protein/tetratricopeptide (TPR) repeat protein|nr:winged helix-turn-helix domain-containing protein [Thermoanaerobaculaceae bacterium]